MGNCFSSPPEPEPQGKTYKQLVESNFFKASGPTPAEEPPEWVNHESGPIGATAGPGPYSVRLPVE
ncbi:hypothetical protein E4U42_000150 [Claviceps africana]|uniref:Uncharacterized protein n=1 Tax=Claviceps africana TaxID=83212 RepID=A0A8K0NFR9_9HYPO|nr:hypothetical protein E4U42_000150 [Claviceps africana]